MQSRREFLASLGAVMFAPAAAAAMQENTGAANVPMEQDAYRPVKLQAKAGAAPSMTDMQRDDLEHKIKCQCGCVLDVFTCRTTDFSCGVSPAMHRDVVDLVAGGYNAAEILGAFQTVYGERVLMAPLKQGFNWLGYIMPFAALSQPVLLLPSSSDDGVHVRLLSLRLHPQPPLTRLLESSKH